MNSTEIPNVQSTRSLPPNVNPDTVMEIARERVRQDNKWGGPEHDDTHHPEDWAGFINQRTEIILRNDRVVPVRGDHYRELLVEIAALAVAAIASHDRKNREGLEP